MTTKGNIIQITGRVTVREHSDFSQYSQLVGLRPGVLATLLIHRELRLKRLTGLKEQPSYRPVTGAGETITSHGLASDNKATFTQHVKALEISASKALGILCRAELAEQWLERALNIDSIRVEN